MMPTTEEFPYMSVLDVADALGVTPQWVVKLIKAGNFPGARKANPAKETSAWLIPTAEFTAFQEQKRPQSSD